MGRWAVECRDGRDGRYGQNGLGGLTWTDMDKADGRVMGIALTLGPLPLARARGKRRPSPGGFQARLF
jgi:hypothetical protein